MSKLCESLNSKNKIMKTLILLLLLLVPISMSYFSYFYNPIALWLTIGIGFSLVIYFNLLIKKENKKAKEFNNRSIYYNTNK